MEFTVKTKFNIGDVVYIAKHYYDLYACKEPRIITDILFCGNARFMNIRYELAYNGSTEILPETWVFGSYEDCTKWCEEYN